MNAQIKGYVSYIRAMRRKTKVSKAIQTIYDYMKSKDMDACESEFSNGSALRFEIKEKFKSLNDG